MFQRLGWHGLLLATALCIVSAPANVAAENRAADTARTWRELREHEILAEFREFLALPNVATDAGDMHANARWMVARLAARGFTSEIWQEGGAPYVFAERKQPGAHKTLLIYAHFDGQPVEAQNWASPPWQPTLRDDLVENGGKTIAWDSVEGRFAPEWRIFARSAGDDKAPLIALFAALDALAAARLEPGVNLKLILDGEEERGSPTLKNILARHGDALAADLMLFCDGPMHQSRQRQLVFGVRGSMTVDLTTYGAQRPLHSGHYGNWAPNPAEILIDLLSRMKDRSGNITVPGFSDGVVPVTAEERAAIAAMPEIDSRLRHELALGRSEGDGARLELQIMKPGLIVKGFDGGGVGALSRNIIQSRATASLNLRLVPAQTPAGLRKVLQAFFRNQGFHVVHAEPDAAVLREHERVLRVDWRGAGYPAFRSRLDSPQAQRLVAILGSIDGKPTLLTPTMGGSLPIYLFTQVLDAPIILLPIANHDNNQHGRNENLRLQNLWDAIEIYAAVIVGFAD